MVSSNSNSNAGLELPIGGSIMEEKVEVDVQRHFMGRVPYVYERIRNVTTLEPDSGFGRAGAKLDPRTGALMYDKFGETVTKRTIIEPEPEPSGVRFSNDSMAMIHIKENEDALLTHTGQLNMYSAQGVVSVQNLSDNDRLWDILVKLMDENDLAIIDFKNIKATELEPKSKVSKEYKIKQFKPSLYVTEIISTHPDYPESVILKKDQTSQVMFRLELSNNSEIPYENIILRKELPQNLSKVIFPEKGDENVTLDEDRMVWKIPILLPGESLVIKFEGDLGPESVDGASTGDITIEANGKDTLTKFVFLSYDAMCRNMYFIEADETDEPDRWLCNFVCGNTSSFEVEILKVEVRDSLTNKVYLDLFKPGINVLPNNRWESQHWMMEGKDRPSFIKTVLLNVIPGLLKEMNFKLTKEASAFHVASLAFNKNFDKKVVVAGRVSDLKAQIEIENTSSAALEHIVVHDSIPRYMLPPTSFKIERGDTNLTDNVRVHITPADDEVATDQLITFQITDLSQLGGPLAKGEKIIISYTTQLIKPAPKTKITALPEVDGKPYIPGPAVSAVSRGDLPTIDTIQILRKFSIGKSIEHGAGIGEYNIGILYKNRGNQPIKDLVIKDILPRNFTGMEYTLNPEQEPTAEQGTILKWQIPTLKEGETTTILYKIKGEGEYHPTDAQIFYNTGILETEFGRPNEIIREEPSTAEEHVSTEPVEPSEVERDAEAEVGKGEDKEVGELEKPKEKIIDKPLEEFKLADD